jgi:hypothetical protein
MYVNGKMIPVETTPGMGDGEIKENGEGVNSSMIQLIHCKNFCKCHNVTSAQQQQQKNSFKRFPSLHV